MIQHSQINKDYVLYRIKNQKHHFFNMQKQTWPNALCNFIIKVLSTQQMKCTFLSSRPQVTQDSHFSPWWQAGSSPCSICRRQGESFCWLLVSTILDTLMTANRQKRQQSFASGKKGGTELCRDHKLTHGKSKTSEIQRSQLHRWTAEASCISVHQPQMLQNQFWKWQTYHTHSSMSLSTCWGTALTKEGQDNLALELWLRELKRRGACGSHLWIGSLCCLALVILTFQWNLSQPLSQ